ncbi:MAG: hypothetical protein CME62_08045 [Halobacteriovoraceae bacterium]|nr:hypothetical protein [Halobacteriovoraceae bacterium]
MLRNHLLYNPFSSQKIKIFIVLMFLLSWELFFISLFVLLIYTLLFKKTQFDRSDLESLQSEILYAPFGGVVDEAESGKLILDLPAYKSFGVQMPIYSTIQNYKIIARHRFSWAKMYAVELVTSSEYGEIKYTFECKWPFFVPRIWCRPGDVVYPSAYIGYLLFGGKMTIEFQRHATLLVRKSDKLLRAQTLLCSKG